MRPLVVETVCLSAYSQLDPSSPSVAADIENVLEEKMETILTQFTEQDPLPLVRLIVDISGFPAVHHQVFGAKFVGRIANPSSLLLMKRKRVTANPDDAEASEETADAFSGFAHFDYMTALIEKSLKEMGGLKILNTQHMREARMIDADSSIVSQYVNKGCSASWHSMTEHLDKLTERLLQSLDLSNANPENVVKLIKEEYSRDGVEYMAALA